MSSSNKQQFIGKALKLIKSKENLRVAIIGRENVGKSTLFNSLLGRQHSIVHNSPGVTRDCQEAKTTIKLKYPMNISKLIFDKKKLKRLVKKINCTFIDTPGANYMDSIIQQTQDSVASSHVALLVTDCKDGLKKWDYNVANYLEMKGIPALHILNKCDNYLQQGDFEELEQVLTKNKIPILGTPIPVSSEMKLGLEQIVSSIQPFHFLTENYNLTENKELYQSLLNEFDERVKNNKLSFEKNEDNDQEYIYETIEDLGESQFFDKYKSEWESGPVPIRNREDIMTKIESKQVVGSEIKESVTERAKALSKERELKMEREHQQTIVEKKEEEEDFEEDEEEIEEEITSEDTHKDDTMRLAIIGRSNVGKSTLLNHLIGEERTRVSSTPGTTRDTIEVEAVNEKTGQRYLICDTAGIRKKKHTLTDRIEEMSLKDTLRTIKYSNVCCLVVDPTNAIAGTGVGLTQQDLEIARMVEKEGRALILACNKWDLVKHPYVVADQIEKQIEGSLAQLQGISVVVCSAKTGKNLHLLLKECEKAYQKWSTKVSAHRLNHFLEQYLQTKPIPASYPRIKFIAQIGVKPPTFCIYTHKQKLPANFERQIMNAIRDEFELGGVPFRVIQKIANSKKQTSDKKN
ncbi:hypothetical protein ABK040_003395 [Willaertia magna]